MKFVMAMLQFPQRFVFCWEFSSASLCAFPYEVSWQFPCSIFRAENFEPYLSQVLKIRWEDELGRKNPLADKEYRYFRLLFLTFCSVGSRLCWCAVAHVADKAVLFLAAKYDYTRSLYTRMNASFPTVGNGPNIQPLLNFPIKLRVKVSRKTVNLYM